MPSSSVRFFLDPVEYAAELQQGLVEITVKQPGSFNAKLCTIELQKLAMQRISEELARTSHVSSGSARAFIGFRAHPGPPVMRNGIELSDHRLVRHSARTSYYQYTSGPTSHWGLSWPLEEIDALCATVAGCDPTPTNDVTVVPKQAEMERLQRLCQAAGDLAEYAPTVLAQSEAARGLEQAITEALLHCFAGGKDQEDTAARRRHAEIMRRFYRVIEECAEQPLYVPELCKAVGASERTLRSCCAEHLGMGPKHYLLLRRMHLFHRALCDSTPPETTVTELATRYGFWQFGRLAAEYKAHFGEAPSATLARSI